MSSRLQKKSSPGFVHDGLPICAWKHALAPQTRACLRHVIVNNVLVNADTWQASACHCEPRPRTRARLPAFSMSLRTPSLHPRTRPSFCMSLRTSAHTGVAIRFPRREAWQVRCCLGKFVTLSRIRLRCCFLLCATAGEADCHVAPLLAMTCRDLLRVRICKHLAQQHPGTTPLHPQKRTPLQHVIANSVLAPAHACPLSACHCEPVRTLVWQSVFPAEKPGKWAAVWANS